MDKYEAYMIEMRNKLALLWLIVEGANNFFEGNAAPLYGLAMRNDMEEAAKGFDMVGAALSELRHLSRTMLGEHHKAGLGEEVEK